MKKYEFDAVIIGSGSAGYACADWLYDFGVKNIAVVTEGKNKGTSRNTGSDKQTYYKLSLCGNADDGVQNMARTLFAGGAMDGDIALCEAANSLPAFFKLVGLGVPFPTNGYGEFVGYKTDHDPYTRATSIGPYTSKKITEVLETSIEKKGVCVLDHCQVVKLIKDGEKIAGLIALDLSDENVGYICVKTPYIVLATGGPATVYENSVYPLGHTGASSLAWDAGAKFVNLSEWQYGLASTEFRWNVSGTYQQVLPRYISVDGQGVEREFLREYLSDEEMLKNIFLKGYEWPFDVRKIHGSSYIDLLVYNETAVRGRTVYLDFTREPSGLENGFEKLDKTAYEYLKNSGALLKTPIARLKKMNPSAIALYSEHGIDLTKRPLKIAVCSQHNNGGVQVDCDWQTNIKGLYACGEVAGTLGIFRPGGTALNSCQVGALRAARHIAYFAENTLSDNFENILEGAVKECGELIEQTRGERATYEEMRLAYRRRMSDIFSFLRSIPAMDAERARIAKDFDNFTRENKWKKRAEIPGIFKNFDLITMQKVISASIAETAKRYGSRGSAFVLGEGSFLERQPLPENEKGRGEVVELCKSDKGVSVFVRPVKPLPERELWFEKVWNEFNALRAKKS